MKNIEHCQTLLTVLTTLLPENMLKKYIKAKSPNKNAKNKNLSGNRARNDVIWDGSFERLWSTLEVFVGPCTLEND